MIGGDRHDRWAQTNTKLSWTQMFCAQKFFGPGKLFEPKILLDPNFFNPNFYGLLKTRSSFLGQWNVLKNNFILDQTFLFNPKYLRTPYFLFGPLNLDFECGTPSSACFQISCYCYLSVYTWKGKINQFAVRFTWFFLLKRQ